MTAHAFRTHPAHSVPQAHAHPVTHTSIACMNPTAKAVREVMDGRSLPQFDATLMERTAYREMFLNGEPPRVAAPSSPAASNLRAISTELLMRLTGVKATSRTEAA